MADNKKYNKRANKSTDTILEDVFSRVPPNAVELEECVLGACLIEKGAFNLISDFLRSNMFYKPVHTMLFEAFVSLDLDNSPIDMHTVTEQLRKQGCIDEVGGPYFIALLTSRVSSAAHIVYHSQIILQKYLARELIRLSGEVQMKAYDEKEDVDDIMNFFEKRYTELSTGVIPAEGSDMIECVISTREKLKSIQEERFKGGKMLIRTPINNLNKSLKGGFRGGQLIILAGRPGMGKTQVAINIAEEASKKAHGIFFSREMLKDEIIQRMVLENELIDDYRMETGQMSSEEWRMVDEQFGRISNLNLSIIDNEASFSKIRSTIRRKCREGKCDFVIIDYIGLIQTGMSFQTRDLEVGFITGNLKLLAMELNIPIIALSQLNRPKSGEMPKRPQLTDLRESGNIEQDADIVVFVHRPCYYNQNAVDDYNVSYRNRGILIKAKHRNGKVDDIHFSHDSRFKRIWDYDMNSGENFTEQANSQKPWDNLQQEEGVPF